MKQIIGRGRESVGLYILKIEAPTSIACFGVTPFKLHCRLGHHSLFVEEAMSSVFYPILIKL